MPRLYLLFNPFCNLSGRWGRRGRQKGMHICSLALKHFTLTFYGQNMEEMVVLSFYASKPEIDFLRGRKRGGEVQVVWAVGFSIRTNLRVNLKFVVFNEIKFTNILRR
jgi:hypothetical protein